MDHMQRDLKKLVADGKHYEAQQMYHNASLRMVSHGRGVDARCLLQEGVGSLLAADKVDMAAQLAKQYVAACEGLVVEDAAYTGVCEDIEQMCTDFPPGAEETKVAVLKVAIKWASGLSSRGAPNLHLVAARCYCALGEHALAAAHYVRAETPVEFARLLVDRWRAGAADEQDLFLCRAVLQYLALGNLGDAHAVVEAFSEQSEGESGGLKPTPLNNFVQLFLSALQRESYPLYAMLCDKYLPGEYPSVLSGLLKLNSTGVYLRFYHACTCVTNWSE